MDSPFKKRITMKLKKPNPLFEQWLTEWRDKAIENDSKMQNCFQKALQSLRKYPLPLESGRDCNILKGFGEKLCKMLDTKLVNYKKEHPDQINVMHSNARNNLSPKIREKEYVPTLQSGAYAILITLYEASLKPQYPGYMIKMDIIKNGQHLCNKSFVRPDPGSYYTAWSSMKTLLDKKLIIKRDCPARYHLTNEGMLVANKLYTSKLTDNAEPKNQTICKTSNNVQEIIQQVKNNSSKSITATGSKNRKRNLLPRSISSSSTTAADEIASQASNHSETSDSACSSREETFIFLPNSFDIILYVDTQEVAGYVPNPLDDFLLNELTHRNVIHQVKHLKAGDYMWVCRQSSSNKELILPYIIERKRMDDLGSSIKDGRFHEQKFRLKQSGIQNLIYLVESHGNNTHTGLPLTTLQQAAINTLIQDNFSVKFTNNTRETVEYLATMTTILKTLYQEKTLVSCPKHNLSQTTVEDDLVSLMTFQEFNKGVSKTRNFKVEELFARQLLQLKGMSVEKTMATVKKYPTPKLLLAAFESTGENLLSTVPYGKLGKKIGPLISKTLYQLYTLNKF